MVPIHIRALAPLLALLCPAIHGQLTRTRPSFSAEQSRQTLGADEGLAILGAALDFGRRHGKPDCSHLVHIIYRDAGFLYSYAKSLDLYRGTDNFVQVTVPQAGDLIVWRTHAGIVVNPAQRSFYSSLHSGLGVDYYDAPHWKSRGIPRLYRFLVIAKNPSATDTRVISVRKVR